MMPSYTADIDAATQSKKQKLSDKGKGTSLDPITNHFPVATKKAIDST